MKGGGGDHSSNSNGAAGTSGGNGGSMWLPSSSQRSTRLSGAQRNAMAPPSRNGNPHSGYSTVNSGTSQGLGSSGRVGDSTGAGECFNGNRGRGACSSFTCFNSWTLDNASSRGVSVAVLACSEHRCPIALPVLPKDVR